MQEIKIGLMTLRLPEPKDEPIYTKEVIFLNKCCGSGHKGLVKYTMENPTHKIITYSKSQIASKKLDSVFGIKIEDLDNYSYIIDGDTKIVINN